MNRRQLFALAAAPLMAGVNRFVPKKLYSNWDYDVLMLTAAQELVERWGKKPEGASWTHAGMDKNGQRLYGKKITVMIDSKWSIDLNVATVNLFLGTLIENEINKIPAVFWA